MSPINKKRTAIALAIASLLALTGCGSNNPPVVTPPPSTGQPLVGSCVPLTVGQPIGFTATNISVTNTRILAGGSYGQIVVGAGAVAAPVPGYGTSFQKQAIEGSLVLNIQSTAAATPTTQPGYGYPYGTTATGAASANGTLTVTQQGLMALGINTYNYPGYTGQPGYAPQPGYVPQPTYGAPGYGTPGYPGYNSICVSGMALDLVPYPSASGVGTITTGRAYLYLNNAATTSGSAYIML